MKTFIVAEIGVNHNGSIETAIELINVAKKAKVNAVKFQCFFDVPEYNHLRLTKDEFIRLFLYADQEGLEWFATPEGIVEMHFLKDQGMKIWKIASPNAKNKDYLKQITGMSPEKIFLSVGGCNMIDITTALRILNLSGEMHLRNGDMLHTKACNKTTVLQCVSDYPTAYKDVNLRFITRIHDWFGCPVGLSDHALGIETAIAAVVLGASVIEKHITLDRNQDGPDHISSIEPNELIDMVRMIRNVEEAM